MSNVSILAHFVRPDASAIARIRNELESLPCNEAGQRVTGSGSEFIGTLTQVLSRLVQEVLKDYEETTIDSTNDGYEFEYVLTRDGYLECEIGILARLFSSTKRKGSIFYEVAAVRRIDHERYLMKVEEE